MTLFLLWLSFVFAQEEIYAATVLPKETGLSKLLVGGWHSAINWWHCGARTCDNEETGPLLTVDNLGIAEKGVEADNEMCTITTLRVSKKKTTILGREGVLFQCDVFALSAAGRYFIVSMSDLMYTLEDAQSVDIFATLEKRFPYGDKILCSPAFVRE